jgi:hypothetical protein
MRLDVVVTINKVPMLDHFPVATQDLGLPAFTPWMVRSPLNRRLLVIKLYWPGARRLWSFL